MPTAILEWVLWPCPSTFLSFQNSPESPFLEYLRCTKILVHLGSLHPQNTSLRKM